MRLQRWSLCGGFSSGQVTKISVFSIFLSHVRLCLGAYSHGMLREVQLLHLAMERQGILLDKNEIFSKLIDGYVGAFDLERAMLVYDRIREQDGGIRKVFRLLCGDGMVQEARNLMKKVMALGFEPSSLIIDDIAFCYCEKNDFEDLASFFVVMKRSPNVLVGNRIIYGLYTNFGVESKFIHAIIGEFRDVIKRLRAWYGTCSYNALIGTVFREGMWKNAQNILVKMVEKGVAPNLSTYRTLLAGYCKARQFDEVKMMVHKMVNYGLIESSSLENPLS
ncbi:hypothetical protein GH714_012363 [Hevea brasiliensis]|uniref:Pentacotripeptide-repeat region of PRORP domain-containing protein n=1 Tax=Hevea brasiliensis TaxID=3981 RepID=A0A6A6MM56_HEVBR|nr:hypothetical protein GH714_012363 [Hevea brasiliensis]